MKKKTMKSKDVRIQEAVDDLNKAMAMKEPEIHFRIWFPGGLYGNNPKSAELLKEIKKGIVAYKKYYGLKKLKIEFVV